MGDKKDDRATRRFGGMPLFSQVRVLGSLFFLVLSLASLGWGGDFKAWTGPSSYKIDSTGGRHGGAALKITTTVEGQNSPWVSPSYPAHGKYLRASAWLKVKDLFYRDLGFYAYASVEFFDKDGKTLGEQTFVRSRELMLVEPLLYQRMLTDHQLLTFDWRYGENTLAVPPGAATMRAQFGFPFRTLGEAWLDDVQFTFSDTKPPEEQQGEGSEKRPGLEIRLRTPQFALNADPLGPLFYPGEAAAFCLGTGRFKLSGLAAVHAVVTDAEGFTVWQQDVPVKTGGWTKVTAPKELGEQWFNRYLLITFDLRDGGQAVARSNLSFGTIEEYKLSAIHQEIEQRSIGRVTEYTHQLRCWMGEGAPMTAAWLHLINVWKDAKQPPDLVTTVNAQPYYKMPDGANAMNLGVVMMVAAHGPPDPVPAFANLGYMSLLKPESMRTFAVAAAQRYPYAKYWRVLCESYPRTAPAGYAEAFVAEEKAFYGAIKSVIPDAVIILDNQCLLNDMDKVMERGIFRYCDAIDPHIYGTLDEAVLKRWLQEKKVLESRGVRKRWISLEFAPFSGGGARGITQERIAQELPKNTSAFYALGGEKICLFTGTSEIVNPDNPFYAGSRFGPGFGPTVNYFSALRVRQKLGLTPAVDFFTLGNYDVQYSEFTDDHHTVIVAWSHTGEDTLKIESPSAVTITDNIRTAEKLEPAQGSCFVTVGVQPVYIEGAPGIKVSLGGTSDVTTASGGGILPGGDPTVTISPPDPAADTVKALLPPGVTAVADTSAVKQGKAEFILHSPLIANRQGATLVFLYGHQDHSNGMVIRHYEFIRSIRAEIIPDAAVRDSRPRYIVRVTNDNPVVERGKVIAESPVAEGDRPEEVERTFQVPPHQTTDVLFEFSKVDMARILSNERNFPAVASVYPDADPPFVIRDQVSFTPLPKVRPGLRIDGDLSDWPAKPSFFIGRPGQYVPLNDGVTPGDIHAGLQIAWDRANLYFAVKIRGRDAAASPGIKLVLTNAEDKRAAYYEEKNSFRSYEFLRGPSGVRMEAHSKSATGEGVWYATRIVPGGIDYEISLPESELGLTVQTDPDRWVKLSAAVLDADGKGYWQWYGGVKEPDNYGAYGDFQLAAYGKDEHGQLYGGWLSGGGRDRDGFTGLALLPDGGRVLVRNDPQKPNGQAIVQDAQGKEARRLTLSNSGYRTHTVLIDADGRLVVGDRQEGINFFSLEDGRKVDVGPLQSFYPVRPHVEYNTQGVAQDEAGDYVVSILRNRRSPPHLEPDIMTLFAGMTLYTRAGEEVKSLGFDLPYIYDGTVVHGFGGVGEAQGYFLYADSVGFDSANRLWVADVDARTLQVFAAAGEHAFSRLPLVYQPMPEGLYPCHFQTLPGGRMLLWNADRMAVASMVDGKISVRAATPLGGDVEDLKVAGRTAVTINRQGQVSSVAGNW